MGRERTKQQRIRADVLLIAALLALGGLLVLLQRAQRADGSAAAVYVNGERVTAYPLDRDATIVLGEGESYNVLVIEDGAARVTEASCPDKLCVHMHAVRYVGESITCLPNRTQILVEGPGEPEVDIG